MFAHAGLSPSRQCSGNATIRSGRSGRVKALTAARAIAARVGSRLVSSPTSADPPLVLLFSKDGAMRLDLFLRSYTQQVSRPLPITVLYLASTESHRQAYEEVFANYASLAL